MFSYTNQLQMDRTICLLKFKTYNVYLMANNLICKNDLKRWTHITHLKYVKKKKLRKIHYKNVQWNKICDIVQHL